MNLKSPFSTKIERGAYSAIGYKDGDLYVTEDSLGTTIKEGTAAVALQAALDAEQNIFLAEETFDIGSTTLTVPDKSMSISGTGKKSIIRGSADPLIDVSQNNANYQLQMREIAIHTTSTNKGLFIDDCNSRNPLWLSNVHFVPEDHAGTLLYIKGMASGHIMGCSFQDTEVSTTAKAIYLTADATAYSQELYLTNCSFWYLNYGVQAYAASGDRAYLAGLHIANSFFGNNDYPIHFKCVDDVTIMCTTIDSPGASAEGGITLNDCISCRIVGNRIGSTTTVGQIEFIGTDLDSYLNTVSTNYLTSYGKVGSGILVDCSPGDKTVHAVMEGNIIYNTLAGVQATKGTTLHPEIVFNNNRLRACTDNIKGDIRHSIVLGNIWGADCSSTVVNGSSGTSEIAHNHKT